MNDKNSSRIEGFHKLAPDARREIIVQQAGLGNEAAAALADAAEG